MDKNIFDIFSIMDKDRDALALCSDQGLEISYGNLQDLVREMQGVFLSSEEPLGGTLAFCMCENRPGAVLGYLGMLSCGVVPLLLDANLQEEQLKHLYQIYRPAFVWASETWHEKNLLQEETNDRVYAALEFELRQLNEAKQICHPELALLLATSGSTGNPKLVKLTGENLRSNAAAIAEYLNLNETERPITTLPMQYTYGLSIINSHLMKGACVLMTTCSYVQRAFWNFLEEKQATSFGGVPYTYEILNKIHIFDKDIPSLRSITQAGGHLSDRLQLIVGEWARRQDINFYIMYGQTEATARMSYLPPQLCLEKPNSIGVPIPGGRFELQDENGEPITQTDVEGELIYYGPNVTMGYASCREDLAAGDEREGCLHTGDLAKVDEEGLYYITGRMKRFVKLFGVRVSLDACERILKERYPQSECVCAGGDDHLVIYTTDEVLAENGPGELAEYLHINFKAFAGAKVEEIPKNSSGKILYNQLPT